MILVTWFLPLPGLDSARTNNDFGVSNMTTEAGDEKRLVNFALNRPAQQSSTFRVTNPAGKAVDGDLKTYSGTENGRWMVDGGYGG